MRAGAGGQETTALTSNGKERAHSENRVRLYTLKAHLHDTLPPSRPPRLNLPRQRHQLETECSNTRAYGGSLTQTTTEGKLAPSEKSLVAPAYSFSFWEKR